MSKTICIFLCAGLATAAAWADSADPVTYISKSLAEANKTDQVLAALRATQDKDLLPVFAALAVSGDKDNRLFAVGTIAEIDKDKALPLLQQRLQKDPSMAIRSEAMIQLLRLKALSDEQLLPLLDAEDESIQCMAAGVLVQHGKGSKAKAVLTRLTGSKDINTACLARLSLLLCGQKSPLKELADILASADTEHQTVALVMERIIDEKNPKALPLVLQVIRSERPSVVKIRAYKALGAIDPQASATLVAAIKNEKQLLVSVSLLEILMQQKDAPKQLAKVARFGGTIGECAAFQLYRTDPEKAAAHAANVLKEGHPVAVEHVLLGIGEDVKAKPRESICYAPALLEYVKGVNPDPEQMSREHQLATRASTLLVDLGADEALAGLRKIIDGRFNAVTKVAAAGILQSHNQKAACALAREMLKSPYDEIVSDAGLTLGKYGDKAAGKYLSYVMAHAAEQPPLLVTLAAWYSLKVQQNTVQAGEAIAKTVK